MRGTHGTFYWNELMTRDVARAKTFYADTIGWTYDAMPMPGGGTYWVAKMGDAAGRGHFRHQRAASSVRRPGKLDVLYRGR